MGVRGGDRVALKPVRLGNDLGFPVSYNAFDIHHLCLFFSKSS